MFSAITSMQRVTLKYVGTHAGVPEELFLDAEEGQKEKGIRLGRGDTVSPALFGTDQNPLSSEAKLNTGTQFTDLNTSKKMMSLDHCWFIYDPEKGWSVTDWSSNGTAFSPPTDSANPAFVRLPKGKSWLLRPGDILVFGGCGVKDVGNSIFKYQVTSEEPPEPKQVTSDGSSAKATSSDGSASPSVMQKLLDSLVEIETLKQENRKLKCSADVLRINLDRSHTEMQKEVQKSVGLKINLKDVEEQLEAECLVKQGAVEALTACKQDLVKANQELMEERAISDKLQRFKNMFDPDVQKAMNQKDGALDFDVEDHQSMAQTLAPEGARSGGSTTRNKRKKESEKPESTEGSMRRNPRRT